MNEYPEPNTHQSSGAAAYAVLAIVMFACFGGGLIFGMLVR